MDQRILMSCCIGLLAAPAAAQSCAVPMFAGQMFDPPSVQASSGGFAFLRWVADLDADGLDDAIRLDFDNDLVVINFGQPGATLSGPLNLTVGDEPIDLAFGDADGDGLIDLFVVNRGSDDISMLWGTADGGFEPEQRLTLALGIPSRIAIGLVDGDAVLDLVVSSYTETVALLSGGDRTFREVVSEGAVRGDLSTADFNGDGLADLLGFYLRRSATFQDQNESSITARFGNGDGTFGETILLNHEFMLGMVAVEDLTGDGIDDVFWTREWSFLDPPLLFRGTPEGRFETIEVQGPIPGGVIQAQPLKMRDLTGDGLPDLVIGGYRSVRVFPWQADLSFGEAIISSSSAASGLLIGNFDCDTTPDLLALSGVVVRGLGGGRFEEIVRTVGDFYVWNALFLDINGDGAPDMIASIFFKKFLSIYLGDGRGGFDDEPYTELPLSFAPAALVEVDLDGNGVLDLVAVGNNDGFAIVAALMRDESGLIVSQAETVLPEGIWSRQRFGDLDGDGLQDLLVWMDDAIGVMLGVGDGTFSDPIPLDDLGQPTIRPLGLAGVGDLNADGRDDICVIRWKGGNGVPVVLDYFVYLNQGGLRFIGSERFQIRDAWSFGLAGIADVDGDGHLDVWSAFWDFYLMRGRGDGTLMPPEITKLDAEFRQLVDFDGDGRLDLLAARPRGCSKCFAVYLNTEHGFERRAYLASSNNFFVADVNSDGRPDIVDEDFSTITTRLNRIGDTVCRADLDHSDSLDFFDVMAFLELLGAQNIRADFSGDGVVDLLDINAFIDSYLLGCG